MFNDQPWECAGVRAMLDNRPAWQNGLEKNIARIIARMIPEVRILSRLIFRVAGVLDFIYTDFSGGKKFFMGAISTKMANLNRYNWSCMIKFGMGGI